VGLRKGITVLVTTVAALASQLPGLSFFAKYAPPSYDILVLLTGGLTLALFLWVFTHHRPDERRIRQGFFCVVAAILLAIAYIGLFRWVTVPTPPETGTTDRYQIGFGMMAFSLTLKGLATAQKFNLTTPDKLMLALGAFQEGGPERVWREWTIITAGVLLSLTYVLTYVAWAYGLACLAWRLIRRAPA
jgi:hypothetical protein